MISLISIATSTVAGLIISILKAVFSMLLWFLKLVFNALKLLFCFLPLTGIIFLFLMALNLFIAVSGSSGVLTAFPKLMGIDFLSTDSNVTLPLISELINWWNTNVFSYRGSGSYLVLILLTIVMFVPVVTVFLFISVFPSYKALLFSVFFIDILIYCLRAVFSKSFVAQYLDRYYLLFPYAGKKHYEKSYERWLRRHHEEFEESNSNHRDHNDRYNDFYEDSYKDDEYDQDNEDYYEDEDYDNYSEDDDYEDGEYDEDDEYYEEYSDEYSEDEEDFYEDDLTYHRHDKEQISDSKETGTSFNFFAGCNSRESVEKKYRSLAKLYHPDNMDGDTASLQEINAQYEEAKKKFPR